MRIVTVIFTLLMLSLSAALAQEAEPNDSFASAMQLQDSSEIWCSFSSNEDVDIYKIYLSTDFIYHFYSDSSDLPEDIHLEMFYEGDTTSNILTGNVDGRAGWGDFRIAGWVPYEYGSGMYYLKVTHPDPITAEYTGTYKIRVITQDLDEWASLHESDDTFAEAFTQAPLEVDGSRFYGMLFDTTMKPTGQDDIDIFYMAGEQGQRLWVETEPVQGYPHTRDMDSKIFIYDGDGNELLAENDDKSDQEEDFDANNVFSLAVIDSLPYTGLYYVVMTSYYAAYNHEGVSWHSDQDPSTGAYVAYAWMGHTKQEVEPNDTPENATHLVEAVTDERVSGKNNLVIDGQFSSDSDVDYYAFNLKTTKMYSFNTVNSSVGGDIKLEVYKIDQPGVNLIDNSVEGNYKDNDFRLSGWIPPENGIYLFKVMPASGSIGGDNTGEYQLRMGWGTYREVSLVAEPDNDNQNQVEENQVEYDSSNTYGALYPAGDVDWFWFEGKAGDIIHVETFSGLDSTGTWGRDLDTKITVIDPSGNVLENDDYRPDEGRHPQNTFSAITNYTLQASGVVWIKVEGYYKDNNQAGKNGTGLYRLFVYSSAAAPEFTERESNDLFRLAMILPDGKEVKAAFKKGGSPSSDDVDIYAINMTTDRMYFANSTDNDLGSDIHVELYSAEDTTLNLLDSNIDGRYNDRNFRLSGFIPPKDTTYYLKLTVNDAGGGNYTIRYRSQLIEDVAPYHEPDNSMSEADAKGDYPLDGVAYLAALYNADDQEFENDVDFYRFQMVAGQVLQAELMPVGGETWDRDTDTKMLLLNAAGDTVAQNDDDFGTYSKISTTISEDGVYYLVVYGYYSQYNGNDANHRDPGVGDYIIRVSGLMYESEPNNFAAFADSLPVANNNLTVASFDNSDLVDWYKVHLEAGKWYYLNSTESFVGSNIQLEIYADADTATNIIDDTPPGRYFSKDFRLSAWAPPSTGDYLLKLSVPAGAIDPQNPGGYKLRIAGGEDITEVNSIHEPDNTLGEADARDELSADGAAYFSALGDSSDHDIYMFNAEKGQSLEVKTMPSLGLRWIRDLDTKIRLLSSDSTILYENDDYDDWYETEFYNGETNNTYSMITVDSLPYTGAYYVDVFSYFSTYNGESPTLGDNATGSYLISVKTSKGSGLKDKTENIPTEFSLEQNYPNPFNPTTTIEYRIKEISDVKLVVYNILGQKVVELVNTRQAPGVYQVVWDGTNRFKQRVATGIYFYRLQSGGKIIDTKKMLLVK